jgi:hypothetical protein
MGFYYLFFMKHQLLYTYMHLQKSSETSHAHLVWRLLIYGPVEGEGIWQMTHNYELYYLFQETYNCHNEGCRNEMAWACHKDG